MTAANAPDKSVPAVSGRSTPWPPGDGEMVRRVRAHDWAATPLGPVEGWSGRLKLVIETVLASPGVSSLVFGIGRLLIYNDTAARLYGDRHPLAFGRPLPDVFPEGWATVAPLYARAFAGEVVQVAAQPLDTRGEGKATDVFDVTLMPVRDDAGEVTAVHMTGQEVSARLRVETALRESEERHRLAMQAVQGMVFDWDVASGRVERSEGLRGLLGFGPEEVEATDAWWGTRMHPDDRAARASLGDRVRTCAGDRFIAEARMRHRDGHWVDVLDSSLVIRGPDGRPTRVVGSSVDVTARKRAETALRESEERLRRVLETDAVAVLFFSQDGVLIDANDIFLRMSGWSREEVEAGRLHWRTMTPPEWVADSDAQMEAVVRTGRLGPYEKEYLRKDGSKAWMLFSGRDLGDGTIVEVAIDITGRKCTEAALRESEERLRQFGNASSDVLWIRDVDTLQWEYLTPAFEAIYGLGREEALRGDNLAGWAELILPEDREHALSSIKQVGQGRRMIFEYRIRRPSDGRVRWLRDTDFPIRDATGRVRRIGGVGQDVTALKEAEAALAGSEARLRTLVEGMPQLVWRSAPRGEWTWASSQWTAFTGLSEEASRGRGWLQALHPDDQAGALMAWDRVGEAGVFQVDYRLRHAESGAWRWFWTRGLPVRDTLGNGAVEWLGTSTDVDDRVRARDTLARAAEVLEARVAERTAELMASEESLRQSHKMEAVGQLTGGIAHDFNNMLQGVAGGVEMARRRVGAGRAEEAERYLQAARDAVDRAAGLTRRLLAFARRQRLEPRSVDVDALVAGMADLIRRAVGPGISLKLRLRDGAGSVQCDPNELENVLLNLCINARDAMPEGGQLVVGTEDCFLSALDVVGQEGLAPGGHVALSVSDTGQGIPPEVLKRVFEPFFTTKPQGQGTGLGLSQVWGFARQSGGLVRIESALGRGTTVRLLLPHNGQTASAEAPASPPPPPAPVAPGATVLLVDDEVTVRGPAAERLRELGFQVIEARDGPDALRVLVSSTQPDLLITDVGLPNGMNGRQVAEAARERTPNLPVLFITGYAGTALPPGVEVINKPFELDTLARRAQSILQARQQDLDDSPSA
ncbi:PAS domain S-box protein [Dankookia rubra]|uniref:histidine kinase n=1 Tax=Dankookia rubra TaxID=1442381 RepID=A0A4R5Q9P9_9PROT|nr:PAS domain S-box protein [Dankookia rubra]TDH59732.1 PAS domain S-box protein [Dankookia rubra]